MSRIVDSIRLTRNIATWNIMYIWELKDWQGKSGPEFHWQPEELHSRLEEVAARRAHLIAQYEFLSGSEEGKASSEQLNEAQVDSLVELLLEAITQIDISLSTRILCQWQASFGCGFFSACRIYPPVVHHTASF